MHGRRSDGESSNREPSAIAGFASTFRGSLLLALGGPTGGAYALLVYLGQCWSERRVRWRSLAGVVAGQLIWLVPGAIVMRHDVDLVGGSFFPTNLGGPVELLGAAAGHGFWLADHEALSLAAAAVIGCGCVVGLFRAWRARVGGSGSPTKVAWAVGVAALALVVSSGVPGVRGIHAWVTERTWGAPLRDSHRLVGLWLFVAIPPAVRGWAWLIQRASLVWRPLIQAGLVAAAVGALGTGWSAGGQLASVDLPAEWVRARSTVQQDPGPVLALPWHQYYDLGIAGGRRSLNVFADFLAADVVAAADPELSATPRTESVDPRLVDAERVVELLRSGESAVDELRELGIRWVVVSSDIEGPDQRQRLARDPGLRMAVLGPSLALFEVRDWSGTVATPIAGLPWVRSVSAKGAGSGASNPPVWPTVPESGWFSGLSALGSSSAGVTLRPDARVMWSVAGAANALVYLVLSCVLWLTRGRRRLPSIHRQTASSQELDA